jgi:DNA repair protein RadC
VLGLLPLSQCGVTLDFEHASNRELLASLAGDAPAAKLLDHYGTLTELAKASFRELTQVHGIGPARAANVLAALSLGRQMTREQHVQGLKIETPERVASLLREEFRLERVERLKIVLLDRSCGLISIQTLAHGTLDTIHIHPRETFRAALEGRASMIILAHNHPSGDPSPSEADIRVTRDLSRAGELLGIRVVDHIIIGQRSTSQPKDYVSMRELGFFY